jgi:BirA family biotin operon repressor/biotin-[acetyl-CoA-carboxylase] ligase
MTPAIWRPGEAWPISRLSSQEWTVYYRAGFRWRERGGLRVLVDGPGALAHDALHRYVDQDPPAGRFAWHVYDTLASTMPKAHDLFLKEGHPVAVLADAQTAGRGRGEHAWHATPGGGLNLSLAWAGTPTMMSGPLTLALGVAVSKAIRGLTGQAVGLKWPNDGLVDGQKCFGILVEASRDRSSRVVAGIGVNVNGDPPAAAGESAVSLENLTGEPWSRLVLAVRIASQIAVVLEALEHAGPAPLLKEWRRMSVTLGQRVVMPGPGPEREGIARNIDEDGSLRVVLADGTEVPVYAGEVNLRVDPP